ncbi:MAG: tripartite tricarboxylate transporter substrate binding protein [Acetobacteraceae bacterium]|nr:tripartite tricarboxylate transporter substrate binding protein [Acetobacteraceae bacterium]MCX7685729.1 tripartite tricarboxylate transporter substrate binding protein [Acetobacteraceae bacterium]MDW8398058.1 tripartite tricarboxylate transporter substrate binding protein [Acetobacteraceae bacterium]
MIRRRHALAAAAALALPRAARAQAWPTQPVRIIVPYPPGGSNDVMGRYLADRISPRVGQPFVVENRPGAGGNLGAEAVARSAPDGHTWAVVSNSLLTANPHVLRSSFDPLRELVVVARMVRPATMLVVTPGLPAQNVRELVALANARRGQFSYPSSGVGSFQHIGVAALVGDAMEHVPYRGAQALLPDLLAGRVHAFVGAANSLIPHVREGRLRALAIMGPERLPQLPEVPTIAEAGFPGKEVPIWLGVALPAATPAPLLARIEAEILAVMADPEGRAGLERQGILPDPLGSAAIMEITRAEHRETGELLRRLGIEPS